MNSSSFHDPSAAISEARESSQLSSLTAEQQEFAEVIGQALAQTWQRRVRQPVEQDGNSLPQQ